MKENENEIGGILKIMVYKPGPVNIKSLIVNILVTQEFVKIIMTLEQLDKDVIVVSSHSQVLICKSKGFFFLLSK